MENNNEQQPGYRLDYLELYNWGTFDGVVERLVPSCNTSLLTGANGSGKTTVVDALLTLLVPNTKRFYNQSSGAEQKKERDETSYVLGYYGKSIEEEGTEARTQMLRKRSDCSVLLGCFFNSATGQYLSLIQVRWFSTELKRAYIVSPHKFTIKEHFNNIDTRGDWRKVLKKQFAKTEINEAFSAYSEVFMHHFGMRSEKALSLFNLTVGIKVIGNLNEFIRQNMLEEGDTEEEFQQLRENFQNLIETHRSIQKAEQQISMLEPIVNKGTEFQTVNTAITELKHVQDALQLYYAGQEKEVRQEATFKLEDHLKSLEGKKQAAEGDLKLLRTQELSLSKSIEENDAQKAVAQLNSQVERLMGEKAKKAAEEARYARLLLQLRLEAVVSEDHFTQRKEQARQELKQLAATLDTLDKSRITKYVEKEQLVKDCQTLEEDITSLRGRQSQIPRKNLEIRQNILAAIGAGAEEIPFIGELIKVRPEAKKWEAAIESLFSNFGLCLLVPDKYMRAVNQYVHQTNLKGRVVYHKVNLSAKPGVFPDIIENSVREKIELKPNIMFEDWLEKRLAQQFDYICTEDQDTFSREPRALMPSGLRKNADRHEKDDSERRSGAENYILGWDNREKLQALTMQLRKKEKQLEEVMHGIKGFEDQKEALQKRESGLKDLQRFEQYSELNWQADEATIIQLEKQKKELLEKAKDLKALSDQLKEVKNNIDRKGEERDKVIGQITLVEQEIRTHQQRIQEINVLLEAARETEYADYYTKLETYIQKREYADPLQQLSGERRATEDYLKSLLKQKEGEAKSLEMAISKAMQRFITPTKELSDQFPDWSGDVLNLGDNIQDLDAFTELYKRIMEEDLPKHKQRFRSYMNDAILERITSFKTSLDLRLEEIELHLKELNTSLKSIDFGKHPPTYIQLLSRPARDPEIRDYFRPALQACMPNVADMALKEQDEWLEAQFIKIKNLIDKLHTDQRLRKKVIDVRNWLDFSAEESFREDGTHHRYYDSSGSLSGGEKAQFTYTVLGAAIAYQFGINQDGSQMKSFRFITVDEAFSKLDPEKSNYLMELCKQLHLQLLVVTPLDKIHIAEPYIAACHFVENKNRTRSHLYNLSMEQYRERKQEFDALSLTE